jgi:ribonuclease HI
MTKDGFLTGYPPSAEDKEYGPAAAHYSSDRLVIASDGSVQKREDIEVMGAAAVSWTGQLHIQSQALSGVASSTKAELAGLKLAISLTTKGRPATILTDSLSSLHILVKRQRQDFQYYKDRPTLIKQVDELVTAINQAHQEGTHITIAKVKAHARDPLNELADRTADLATLLEPEEESTTTTECTFKGSNIAWKGWNAAIKTWLKQQVAEYQLQRITAPKLTQEEMVSNPLSRTSDWMLWQRAHRHTLGKVLSKIKPGQQQKVVLQAISNVFPTQVNLHRWNGLKHTSTNCPLGCGEGAETFSHIQCVCPKLQAHRIAAHHKIWKSILTDIQKYYPHRDFILSREETIAGIIESIRQEQSSSLDLQALLTRLRRIQSVKAHPDQESQDTTALPS